MTKKEYKKRHYVNDTYGSQVFEEPKSKEPTRIVLTNETIDKIVMTINAHEFHKYQRQGLLLHLSNNQKTFNELVAIAMARDLIERVKRPPMKLIKGNPVKKKKRLKPTKKEQKWISKKIAYLIKHEGRPVKQAAAIAYSMAEKKRKKKKKKTKGRGKGKHKNGRRRKGKNRSPTQKRASRKLRTRRQKKRGNPLGVSNQGLILAAVFAAGFYYWFKNKKPAVAGYPVGRIC